MTTPTTLLATRMDRRSSEAHASSSDPAGSKTHPVADRSTGVPSPVTDRSANRIRSFYLNGREAADGTLLAADIPVVEVWDITVPDRPELEAEGLEPGVVFRSSDLIAHGCCWRSGHAARQSRERGRHSAYYHASGSWRPGCQRSAGHPRSTGAWPFRADHDRSRLRNRAARQRLSVKVRRGLVRTQAASITMVLWLSAVRPLRPYQVQTRPSPTPSAAHRRSPAESARGTARSGHRRRSRQSPRGG